MGKNKHHGFTLVELMIVIVIIGVLAALASFGFMQYVKKSKTAEADEILERIGKGAKIYFTSEQFYGGDEAWHSSGTDGFPVPFGEKTFPGGLSYVFNSHTAIPQGGVKLTPDFDPDTNNNKKSLRKLSFSLKDPTYFRYTFETNGSAGGAARATVTATADFQPGGDMHTAQRIIVVEGDEPTVGQPIVTNEFE